MNIAGNLVLHYFSEGDSTVEQCTYHVRIIESVEDDMPTVVVRDPIDPEYRDEVAQKNMMHMPDISQEMLDGVSNELREVLRSHEEKKKSEQSPQSQLTIL